MCMCLLEEIKPNHSLTDSSNTANAIMINTLSPWIGICHSGLTYFMEINHSLYTCVNFPRCRLCDAYIFALGRVVL